MIFRVEVMGPMTLWPPAASAATSMALRGIGVPPGAPQPALHGSDYCCENVMLWRGVQRTCRCICSKIAGIELSGGIAVRNLPQFYRNFSMMPLFKNFSFPLRKILSLPSLLLGTLCVYVFSSLLHVIYVAGRFSVFVFPKCHPLLGTVIPAMPKGQ